MSCSASDPCSVIWSTQKPVFRQYLPVCDRTHRCLELKIWQFLWRRQMITDCFTPCACTRDNNARFVIDTFDIKTLLWWPLYYPTRMSLVQGVKWSQGSVAVVDTRIAWSQHLGSWATFKHDECGECGEKLVSQARPSHSAAFSSFRINARRVWPSSAYTRLGPAGQDFVRPIRFVENVIMSR